MAKTPRDPNRPKRQPKPGQTKGYCCPPESGKIKPGEVRNPYGPKGKPKPVKIDPFEFAASQITKVTINGETFEVDAETAAWLKNMAEAVKGDQRAHQYVMLERQHRRSRMPAVDIEKELEDARTLEDRKALSAKLIGALELQAQLVQERLLAVENGNPDVAPWVRTAIREYLERGGKMGDDDDGPDEPSEPSA